MWPWWWWRVDRQSRYCTAPWRSGCGRRTTLTKSKQVWEPKKTKRVAQSEARRHTRRSGGSSKSDTSSSAAGESSSLWKACLRELPELAETQGRKRHVAGPQLIANAQSSSRRTKRRKRRRQNVPPNLGTRAGAERRRANRAPGAARGRDQAAGVICAACVAAMPWVLGARANPLRGSNQSSGRCRILLERAQRGGWQTQTWATRCRGSLVVLLAGSANRSAGWSGDAEAAARADVVICNSCGSSSRPQCRVRPGYSMTVIG